MAQRHVPRARPASSEISGVPTLVRGDTPLDVAENAFRLLTVGPRPLAVDGRALDGGLPARMIALDELASVLMHPSSDYRVRDRVWRSLVERARTGGPAWTVGAVGVALPGLRSIASRLARTGGRSDVEADLLAGFLAALSGLDVGPERVCARLCNAAHIAARRALRTARETTKTTGSVTEARAPGSAGHPDLVLARAVRLGVIGRDEAELVGATRLEGISLADYADRHGLTRWAAYQRRGLAEARLGAALRSGRLEDSDAQTIAEATLTTVADPGREGLPSR